MLLLINIVPINQLYLQNHNVASRETDLVHTQNTKQYGRNIWSDVAEHNPGIALQILYKIMHYPQTYKKRRKYVPNLRYIFPKGIKSFLQSYRKRQLNNFKWRCNQTNKIVNDYISLLIPNTTFDNFKPETLSRIKLDNEESRLNVQKEDSTETKVEITTISNTICNDEQTNELLPSLQNAIEACKHLEDIISSNNLTTTMSDIIQYTTESSSKPDSASNIMGEVLERVKSLQASSSLGQEPTTNEGLPCHIEGSWSSAASGMLINISESFDTMETSLSQKSPPGEGFLTLPGWKLKTLKPFIKSSELIIVAYRESNKHCAVFIGNCRTCSGNDIISGNWLIARPTRNCQEERATQELIGDVWRRENLSKLIKQRLQQMAENISTEKNKSNPATYLHIKHDSHKGAPTAIHHPSDKYYTTSPVRQKSTKNNHHTTKKNVIQKFRNFVRNHTMHPKISKLLKPIKKSFNKTSSKVKSIFKSKTTAKPISII